MSFDEFFHAEFRHGINNNASYRLLKAQGWEPRGRAETDATAGGTATACEPKEKFRSLPCKVWPGSDEFFDADYCHGFHNNAPYRLLKTQGLVPRGRDENPRDRRRHRYGVRALKKFRSLPSKVWPGSDEFFDAKFRHGIHSNASYRLLKAQGWVPRGRDESGRDSRNRLSA